jgi:hypothetical protein
MMGFKSFWSATKIIAGIETMHMIKKGQLSCPGGLAVSPTDHFYSLAAESIPGRHRPSATSHRYCDRAFGRVLRGLLVSR